MPVTLGLDRLTRLRPVRQRLLPFLDRSHRRVRFFKTAILFLTLLAICALVAASSSGRFYLLNSARQMRDTALRRLFGLEPDRAVVEAEWALKRQRGIEQTEKVLTRFYNKTTPQMRELFRVAGMDPEHGLIRYGRADQAFLISSQVFEIDNHGRSYRFRPKTKSVWLRQVTLHDGPFGLFQVLDTSQHRAAAAAADAIVDERSIQNTNSWGLRGPEPDPTAQARGIVLGDSFMQGMFNGDGDTPPLYLERCLREAWKMPVSVLNTGHIGYSPEQYYYSLKEYGDRFRPQFVVVSVCPNDFGDGWAVLRGEGDWYGEAGYWLDQIHGWCRSRSALCLLVAVPTHVQVENIRRDDLYPGKICDIFRAHSSRYCDPLDAFVDEHLRLAALARRNGQPYQRSKLYNREIDDDHFSPIGASLWAQNVSRRITLILDPPSAAESSQVGPVAGPVTEQSAHEHQR
jgi:hypothetical protein